MKHPVDLLQHNTAKDEEHTPSATGQPPSFPSCFSGNNPKKPSTNEACEKPAYGDFVENLSRSIVERNAQARKGPRGHLRSKQRSRAALGRALSRLMQDE